MKKIILLFFLLESIAGFSQNHKWESPDYKKIEKDIAEKESNVYYPKLLERYLRSDTTMTLEEKRYVYYGYTFQPGYSPYGSSNYMDSLRPIVRKQNLTADDYPLILRFCDSVLTANPFDMDAINYSIYCHKKMGDMVSYHNYLFKMNTIFDALFSSGDGLSKETAFYVIVVSHEYDMLEAMGFKYGGTQNLIAGHYDFLKVAANDSGIEGFYFDVSPCFKYLDKMFNK